jgi:hypothetical protein
MKKKEVEEKYKEIAHAIRSHTETLARYFDELNHAVREQTDLLADLANALDPSRLQPSIDKHFTACAGGQTPQESEVTDSFIVTQGDKVLCRDCLTFTREATGSNPKMRKCGTRKYGRCSYCGLEILYPKTMDDWKREVSEAERDLNTGKEKE